MRQTTWTPVYFIAQLFYFIALVRTALGLGILDGPSIDVLSARVDASVI